MFTAVSVCAAQRTRVVWPFQTDSGVVRAIQYAISLGGDTDTIASMAGAIAGECGHQTSLAVCVSVYLAVCLTVYVCLSVCVYLSVSDCVCLFVPVSVYLSVFVSICLPVSETEYMFCLSVCLPACLSVHICICIYISLSVYLSVSVWSVGLSSVCVSVCVCV